ncbi:DUF3175 domain-containing protein [Candidatus Dependentiae bacterium]
MNKKEGNLWSADVETKWHAPEGFFEQSAEEIAKGLKAASDSLDQAMSRLNFYINRAGTKLSEERKNTLEKAKKILDQLYGR